MKKFILLIAVVLLAILVIKPTKKQEAKNDGYSELVSEESKSEEENEVIDNSPAFEIEKKKSAGYNVWSIKENPKKVSELRGEYYYEICPKGLFDVQMSSAKAQELSDAPVLNRDVTWSAAYRALENLIPVKDSKIIFDFSKFNRQIIDRRSCLFSGSCQIKNEKGKYVDAEVSMKVLEVPVGNYNKPDGWYCVGNIVF